MAKGKNEILLSIALEGGDDVKRQLATVGDIGKKSLADIEKNLGAARQVAERGAAGIAAPFSKVREAIAPLTEASGLGGILGSLGAGGLFGRLAAGLTSPAGLVAGITGALLGMAKLGDETQRQKGRLAALGDAGGFDRLNEQAKALGVSVSDLQPRFEKFRAFQQQRQANSNVIRPAFREGPDGSLSPIPNDPNAAEDSASGVRIINGGRDTSAPSTKRYEAFSAALFRQIRRDVGDKEKANQIQGDFESGLFQNGLTGDALRSLQGAAPNAANFVAGSLSQKFGRNFANPAELAKQLDNGRLQVSPTDLINEGAKAAPDANKVADASRGVTESFEALEAAAKRLAEAFGGDAAGLTKGIDSLAKVVDGAAEGIDRQLHAKEYLPGGQRFIGPVRPEDDRLKAPSTLGEVFSSDKGDLLGRMTSYLSGGAKGGLGPLNLIGPTAPENPFGVISDFLRKAVGDPGALQERPRPAEGPAALQPPAQPQQQGAAGPNLLESIAAAMNSFNEKNLKVEGPATGLGIRGSLEDPSQSVAAVKDAGADLAAAISSIAANIRNSSAEASPIKVQAARDGGWFRRFLGGGRVSGPGTTTSDSIPALLSDKEFVVNAEDTQKHIGLLTAINSGRFSLGGMVRRLAGGGPASGSAASVTGLGPGNHQISYDPDTGGAYVDGVLRLPGDPILNDPVVAQAIARSKAADAKRSSSSSHKSDFVGAFGGHVFGESGSYAKGGMVDWPGFAGGGLVGGGLAMDVAPAVSDGAGPWGDFQHLGTLDVRGERGEARVTGKIDALRQLNDAARDAAVFQTGPRPSHYGGGR